MTAALALALSAALAGIQPQLSWHAPTLGSWSCGDGVTSVREPQTHYVLALRGQYPNYRPGIEDTPEWKLLTAWCAPDTLYRFTNVQPGDSLACNVAGGTWYAVVARNSRGYSCWALRFR